MADSSKTFEDVLKEELQAFNPDARLEEGVINAAHRGKLSGLAFSGGGIRSATFNLGVLQGLAHLGILDKFHYLSTVSGGGYIGSWLTAWIRRENMKKAAGKPNENAANSRPGVIQAQPEQETGSAHTQPASQTSEAKTGTETQSGDTDGLRTVIQELKRSATWGKGSSFRHTNDPCDPKPISHLRRFSNYLTPRRSWWNNDTWTLGVIYIRNFVLNFSVLMGTLLAGICLVYAGMMLYKIMHTAPIPYPWINFIIYAVFLGLSASFCSYDLAACRESKKKESGLKSYSMWTTNLAIISVVILIWFGGAGLWHLRSVQHTDLQTILMIVVAVFAALIAGGFAGKYTYLKSLTGLKPTLENLPGRIFALAVAAFCLLMSIYLLTKWIKNWPEYPWVGTGPWLSVIISPLLVLLVYAIFAAAFVGVAGNSLDEMEREWLARLFAAITKWTILFCLLTALILFTPIALGWIKDRINGTPNGILGLLWAGISSAGALLAQSEGLVAKKPIKRLLTGFVMAIAPIVFMVGLIVISVWSFNAWIPEPVASGIQSNYFKIQPNATWNAYSGNCGKCGIPGSI